MYLDGGETPIGQPSTIIDATGEPIRIVRDGALHRDELESVAGKGAVEDGLGE